MEQRIITLLFAACALAASFVLGRWSHEQTPAPTPVAGNADPATADAVEELRRDVQALAAASSQSGWRAAVPAPTNHLDQRLTRIEETLAALAQTRGAATPALAFASGLRNRLKVTAKQIEHLRALYREFGSEDIYEANSPLTERFRFLTPPEILTDLGQPDHIDATDGAMEWSYEVETTDLVGQDRVRQLGATRSFYCVQLMMIGGMVIEVTGVHEHRLE